MKLIITCWILIFGTAVLYGQNPADITITEKFQDEPLESVLKKLKSNYLLKFKYDKSLVKNIRITGSFWPSSLDQAMKKILEATVIDYKFRTPRTVVLFPKIDKITDWSKVVPTRKYLDISGIVKNKNTGETLPFANVLVKGTTNGVTTNIDGYFTLFNVPTDTTSLVISYIGYRTMQFRLTPKTDVDKIAILLDDFGVQLDEVVVSATREEQMLNVATGVSRIGISPAALAKLPNYGEKDLFRSLQLLPGVSGSNESSSGLFVRGGTPNVV